jgi:hypothetical protein
MIPTPMFRAEITFHFRENQPPHQGLFGVSDDYHRRVPMQMEGVQGLHTVMMWFPKKGTFRLGDTVVVECSVIAPQLFNEAVQSGAKFELWDGRFIAAGKVLERVQAGWPNEA